MPTKRTGKFKKPIGEHNLDISFIQDIEKQSIHHVHAKKIAQCLRQPHLERIFWGWYQEFSDCWLSEEEARAAFFIWTKG